MQQANTTDERRAAGKRVVWAAVGIAAVLLAGVTVQWFAGVPDEAADRMELVSSSWSNDGAPVLKVVTRLRRSDGRRVYPHGSIFTRSWFTQMKVNTASDLADRSVTITAEIRYAQTPHQPVVMWCTALQPRASRGMLLLASWERKLFHRIPKWLPSPTIVRLPDFTVTGPEVASAAE